MKNNYKFITIQNPRDEFIKKEMLLRPKFRKNRFFLYFNFNFEKQ